MSARKDDQGKAPLSMIPRSALLAEARVMAFGAQKYGRDNWRGGMERSRLADAALRHILAWVDGEDADPETGESHWAHVRCCAAFQIEYEERGLGVDNRFVPAAQNEPPGDDGIRLVVLAENSQPSAFWGGRYQSAPLQDIPNTDIRLPANRAFLKGASVWARPVPLHEGYWLEYIADFAVWRAVDD